MSAPPSSGDLLFCSDYPGSADSSNLEHRFIGDRVKSHPARHYTGPVAEPEAPAGPCVTAAEPSRLIASHGNDRAIVIAPGLIGEFHQPGSQEISRRRRFLDRRLNDLVAHLGVQ